MYLRIVEYGEHPHSKGLQRINYGSARRLEAQFRSLRGLLARRFGGLPVYVGHPDDPEYRGQPGHSDTRAHGWVSDLQARPDGLYGYFKWAPTGRDLLENAHYKHLSPRWAMRALPDGCFEPVRLLSIGLTNTPNIPGETIANEDPGAPGARPHSANGADGTPVTRSAHAGRDEPEGAADASTRSTEQSGPVAVAPAPESAAANSAPPPRPGLSTTSRTLSIGRRRSYGRSAALTEAVNTRMGETGESFLTAWNNIKSTRPDLFQ